MYTVRVYKQTVWFALIKQISQITFNLTVETNHISAIIEPQRWRTDIGEYEDPYGSVPEGKSQGSAQQQNISAAIQNSA